MRKASIIAVIALFASAAFAQQGNSCLIVKHKGTIGRRLVWTALIGVPIAPGAAYDYVDSANFSNQRMSYKGKQLQEIQQSGTHVVIIDKFTPEALTAARQSCAASAPPPTPSSAVQPVPEKQVVTAAPESITLSNGASGAGSVDGDQTSLGDAARQARAKKQQQPQPPQPN